MRISDWSSDVCSSDLIDQKQRSDALAVADAVGKKTSAFQHGGGCRHQHTVEHLPGAVDALGVDDPVDEYPADRRARRFDIELVERSEERRVGNACVRTCRSRWSR